MRIPNIPEEATSQVNALVAHYTGQHLSETEVKELKTFLKLLLDGYRLGEDWKEYAKAYDEYVQSERG